MTARERAAKRARGTAQETNLRRAGTFRRWGAGAWPGRGACAPSAPGHARREAGQPDGGRGPRHAPSNLRARRAPAVAAPARSPVWEHCVRKAAAVTVPQAPPRAAHLR